MNNKYKKTNQKEVYTFIGIGTVIVAILLSSIGILNANKKKQRESGAAISQLSNSNEVFRQQMSDELNTMFDYLSQLDETINAQNQELLRVQSETETSMYSIYNIQTENRNEVVSHLKSISEYLTQIEEVTKEHESTIESILDTMQTSNSKEMQDIKYWISDVNVLIKGGNQEIAKILTTLSDDNEYNYLEINKNISTVYDYIVKLEENLALTEEALQGTIMLLHDSESKNHLETVALLETIHNDISDIINSSFGDLSQEINISIEQLSYHLTVTHEQILQTKAEITDILEIMQNDNREMRLQVEAMIAEVNNNVLTVQQNLDATHEELKELIIMLQKSEDERHTILLETINQVEQDMGESADNSFLQITKSIESLHTNICNEFKTLNQNLEGDFTALSDNLSNYAYFVEQQINSYSEKAGEDNNFLKTIIESSTNNINNRLDSVFQLVSNGKRNIASALLTKGVSIKEDATFNEIYKAILEIPQQLLIGVEQIPGEISYDYHYHVGTEAECDGCYTKPVYHAHSSSCYKNSRCSCSGFTGNHNIDKGCESCGHHYDYHWTYDNGNYVPSSCTFSTSVLNCNKGGTIERYSLDCGLSDGQIIGAHIMFN